MDGEIKTTTTTEVQPETTKGNEPLTIIETTTPPIKEDLVSRVSKVKPTQKETQETNTFNLTKEDYEKVTTDPVLSKFYKSMQSDYVKKTQEIAETRKILESQRQPTTWTPERLQQEINKPDFIQAAQTVAASQNPPGSPLTQEEYSALSDKEKAQLNQTLQRVQNLEMQNWQMLQKQQDEQLKTKYANYAPDIVDVTIKKLVNGEIKADREVVWKALDYNDAVERAYQLGLQDRQITNTEKTQSMSTEGLNVTPTSEPMKPNAGESFQQFWRRIADKNLSAIKGQK